MAGVVALGTDALARTPTCRYASKGPPDSRTAAFVLRSAAKATRRFKVRAERLGRFCSLTTWLFRTSKAGGRTKQTDARLAAYGVAVGSPYTRKAITVAAASNRARKAALDFSATAAV